MIKIENVSTVGWEAAIRGARNPMNSWEKSDSVFEDFYNDYEDCYGYHDVMMNRYFSDVTPLSGEVREAFSNDIFYIGPNDLKLLSNLAKAGSDEAKFRRMIVVYLDVTAPMYWWKECDTYKVGTVRNSCSTMHKIHAKEFTLEDFSTEHLIDEFNYTWIGEGDDEEITVDYCLLDPGTHPGANDNPYSPYYNGESTPNDILTYTIAMLNRARELYLKIKDKKYWWQMIQLLPSSYNQRATLMLNYEVLANMYHARKNHKLDEWREFCRWIETLPYAKELIIGFQMRTDIYKPTILPKGRFKVKVCDEKDGIIELRRGVPDLYLGDGVDWAQVRIQVDQDHYIKGMAMYKDDMPEDCDVIVNVRDDGETFKDLDYKCAFSRYSHQKLKQIFYKDPSTGDFKLSPINIVSDSFDWAEWSRTLPSTFLSKEKEKELIKKADEHLRKGGVDIPEEEENKS